MVFPNYNTIGSGGLSTIAIEPIAFWTQKSIAGGQWRSGAYLRYPSSPFGMHVLSHGRGLGTAALAQLCSTHHSLLLLSVQCIQLE